MKEDTKLEACPFCWRDERHLDISLNLSSDHYVDCGCGAQGPIMPTKAEAIAAWNARANTPLSVDEEMVERVAKAIRLAWWQHPRTDPADWPEGAAEDMARAAITASNRV